MFNAQLLGNGHYHVNRITADISDVGDMMGCDHPSFVEIGPLAGSYGTSNIFQHGGCLSS